MKDIKQIEQEANEVIKTIKGSSGYVEKVKVVEKARNTSKPKKVFPKTPSMILNQRCGLGKYPQPLFPLVRDDKGEIVSYNGTRYSRRRQHYPV